MQTQWLGLSGDPCVEVFLLVVDGRNQLHQGRDDDWHFNSAYTDLIPRMGSNVGSRSQASRLSLFTVAVAQKPELLPTISSPRCCCCYSVVWVLRNNWKSLVQSRWRRLNVSLFVLGRINVVNHWLVPLSCAGGTMRNGALIANSCDINPWSDKTVTENEIIFIVLLHLWTPVCFLNCTCPRFKCWVSFFLIIKTSNPVHFHVLKPGLRRHKLPLAVFMMFLSFGESCSRLQ